MKNQGNNSIVVVIALVIVLGLGALLLARKNLQTSYQNPVNQYQVTGDTSDPALDKDMSAIDQSLNSTNDANTSVAQGISDTPVPQP